MAKYEDYVKQEGSIEEEIEQASEASAQRESDIPEQFRGKSAEEIAASYQALKDMNDRQANELGELRKATSQLTQSVLQSSAKPEPETAPITVDDLYENPQDVISRVVEQKVSGKLEELDRVINRIETKGQLQDLAQSYPTYKEDAQSPEMRNWIAESGYRTRLAAAADAGDLQAADDLFGMYYDLTGTKEQKRGDAKRSKDLSNATLESGTSDVHSPVEKFSRSKLEVARRQAKRGNMEAEAFLKENADAIFRAYEEGRIVN